MSEQANTPKWTEERTEQVLRLYDESDKTPEAVKAIAGAMETSHRSVIGKLVEQKVYQAPEKPEPAKKDEGPTKKDLQADLEDVGIDVEGSEGATKAFLAEVLRFARDAA